MQIREIVESVKWLSATIPSELVRNQMFRARRCDIFPVARSNLKPGFADPSRA